MAWWNEGIFASSCWNMCLPLWGSFVANKNVGIKDWRLGLMFRLLQLCIVGYVVYDVVSAKSYLERETPVMSFQTRTVGGPEFTKARLEAVTSPPEYCLNPQDYEYEIEIPVDGQNGTLSVDTTEITPIMCANLDRPIIASNIGPSTVLIGTYIYDEITRYRKNITSADQCPPKEDVYGPDKSNYASEPVFLSNTCTYKLIEQSLPIAPEEITVAFSFNYKLPQHFQANGDSSGITCTIRSEIGDDETIVSNPAGDMLFQAPVSRWLEMAGVDLDDSILQNQEDEDGTPLGATGTAPKARVTGMELTFSVSVYNEGLQPFGETVEGRSCTIEIKPTLFWTAGPTQVFRLWDDGDNGGTSAVQVYGILFTFIGGGTFGSFSWKDLINALIAGAVLLSVAQQVTTMVALYALGHWSKLYGAFINETVDYKHVYAKYASQCMVAAEFFAKKDVDNTEAMERDELFRSLQSMYSESLQDEDILALTDFMIAYGDCTTCKKPPKEGEEVVKSRGTDTGSMSMQEWFNCFSDDKCDLKMLQKILESDYNEQEREELKFGARNILNPPALKAEEGNSDAVAAEAEVEVMLNETDEPHD